MQTFNSNIAQSWDVTMPYLLLFLAASFLDIFMGIALAFARCDVSARDSRKGMTRKAASLGIVLLAAVFDGILPPVHIVYEPIGLDLTLTYGGLMAARWTIYELVSITAKAKVLGLPMPKRVRDALKLANDTLDGVAGQEDGTKDAEKV